MPNIIPEKVLNFNIYADGGRLMGVADGTFPPLEIMTAEVKEAGVAGTIDAPGIGHFGSLVITLNWRLTTQDFWELGQPGGHILDMYNAGQQVDAGDGSLITTRIHIFARAFTKKLDPGKMSVMETQDAQTEHEVYYLKADIDGQEVIEIDKYNYMYRVNGVDYLEDVRSALGMR